MAGVTVVGKPQATVMISSPFLIWRSPSSGAVSAMKAIRLAEEPLLTRWANLTPIHLANSFSNRSAKRPVVSQKSSVASVRAQEVYKRQMQQRTAAGQQGKQQHRQTGHRCPAVDLHRRQPPVFVQPQSGCAGRFHLLLHHRGLYLVVKILLIHSLDNRLGHVVDHLVGHAGVNADPERCV